MRNLMESVSLSARIRIARVDGRVFEAVRATVRESRRDARAPPNEQQYSPIEPDENSLPLPKAVQERGQSTLQPKMRSHTIENRFYAMLLDRPGTSIFSWFTQVVRRMRREVTRESLDCRDVAFCRRP